jgi:hypothetical protein
MNIKKIKYIFKKNLNIDIQDIVDFSTGADHKIYIISHKNKKYVYRESLKNKNTLYNINFILSKLKSKYVPKIIVYNKNYLIETFINGNKFNEKDISKSNIENIYFQVGKLLKEIHSNKSNSFSEWGFKLNLAYKKNFYRSIYVSFYKNLKEHIKRKNFTNKEILTIKNYFTKNNDFLKKINTFSIINADVAKDHIIIYKNKFNGLIDFGDCRYSDPLFDFIHLYDFKYDYKIKALEKGYNKKLDLNKIEFYKFIHSVWCILWCQDNNCMEESKDIKKTVLCILNK